MIHDINVVLIGDSDVGKATLAETLRQGVQSHGGGVGPGREPLVSVCGESCRMKITDVVEPCDAGDTDATTPPWPRSAADPDVCVVCYDVSRPETFARIDSHWLPRLANASPRPAPGEPRPPRTPVILAGLKRDLAGDLTAQGPDRLSSAARPVLDRWREVEYCLECSAQQRSHVTDLAQVTCRAALFPTRPLVEQSRDAAGGRPRPVLTRACWRAIERVFRELDTYRAGVLSEKEVNELQVRSFGTPLTHAQYGELLQLVQEVDDAGVAAVPVNLVASPVKDAPAAPPVGLTLAGFGALIGIMVGNGSADAVWRILFDHGYDRRLRISQQVISKGLEPLRPTGRGRDGRRRTAELSPTSVALLERVFHRFDSSGCGTLSVEDVEAQFLTRWDLLAFDDPASCVEHLVLVGLPAALANLALEDRNPPGVLAAAQRLLIRAGAAPGKPPPPVGGTAALISAMLGAPTGNTPEYDSEGPHDVAAGGGADADPRPCAALEALEPAGVGSIVRQTLVVDACDVPRETRGSVLRRAVAWTAALVGLAAGPPRLAPDVAVIAYADTPRLGSTRDGSRAGESGDARDGLSAALAAAARARKRLARGVPVLIVALGPSPSVSGSARDALACRLAGERPALRAPLKNPQQDVACVVRAMQEVAFGWGEGRWGGVGHPAGGGVWVGPADKVARSPTRGRPVRLSRCLAAERRSWGGSAAWQLCAWCTVGGVVAWAVWRAVDRKGGGGLEEAGEAVVEIGAEAGEPGVGAVAGRWVGEQWLALKAVPEKVIEAVMGRG
ncbi:unnamed protein product [Pedinophyceae sp. YPF-701]|nr:unnamed protein product [Pedinophyceae sp. YPF-701]